MNEPSDATRQAQAKADRVSLAFAEVFGFEKKRTAAQKIVVEHLTVCAGDDGNAYRFNEAKDGVALIAAGIHRDGAQSLLKVIKRQLQFAGKVGEPKPAKPQVIKR